jgi:hypothetical protein
MAYRAAEVSMLPVFICAITPLAFEMILCLLKVQKRGSALGFATSTSRQAMTYDANRPNW